MDQVSSVRLDTNVTPNQGGTYSSASIARGGPQIRTAAAEARLALFEMASKRLNVLDEQPYGVERRRVDGGRLEARHLRRTRRRQDVQLAVHRIGAGEEACRRTRWWPRRSPRRDLPAKVSGTYIYMQHVRVPGMLHGRVVRPRGQRAYGAGARVVSVDEDSLRGIPGARVLRKGDFLGVVAENEWDAVRAARQLKVDLGDARPRCRAASRSTSRCGRRRRRKQSSLQRGDVAAAFASAAHVVSQTLHAPYQAHAPFGPNCAVADVKVDSALVMCSTQDVYATRRTLATLLKLPVERFACSTTKARAPTATAAMTMWRRRRRFFRRKPDSPCACSSCAGTSTAGTTTVRRMSAKCAPPADAGGKLVAYEYHGWQHSWSGTEASAQLAGEPAVEFARRATQGVNRLTCGGMYRDSQSAAGESQAAGGRISEGRMAALAA